MNIFQRLIYDRKKLGFIIAVLFFITAILLSVFISRKQQETRQRASGEEATLYFAKSDNTSLNQLNLQKGKQESFSVYVNTGSTGINIFDVRISLANIINSIENINITEADTAKFDVSFFKTIDQTSGIIRLSKGSLSSSTAGTTRLGTITFNVKSSAVIGPKDNIGITKAEITSPGRRTLLSTNLLSIPSSVIEPLPVTSTPMPTSTPTPSPTSAPPSATPTPNPATTLTVTVESPSVPVAVGSTFTVPVKIYNGSHVGAFQIKLNYNPSVIKIIAESDVTAGPFISSTGRGPLPMSTTINNTNGSLVYGISTLGSTPAGASGNGILANVKFTAIGAGQSPITLVSREGPGGGTIIGDEMGNDQPIANLNSGSVTVSSQNPTATPPQRIAEDVNGDGCISLFDFNEWVYAFQNDTLTNPNNSNSRPDINGDGQISLLDFNMWADAFRSGEHECE